MLSNSQRFSRDIVLCISAGLRQSQPVSPQLLRSLIELWAEVLALKELRRSENGWLRKWRLRMLVSVLSLSWLLLLRRALKYRLSLAFSRCYRNRASSRL